MEKQIAPTEQMKARTNKLFTMGFSKRRFGFSFQSFFINNYQIEYLSGSDWDSFMEYVTQQITIIKGELGAVVSDKLKLEGFTSQLSEITGPELASKEACEIRDAMLESLKDFISWLKSETGKLPQ